MTTTARTPTTDKRILHSSHQLKAAAFIILVIISVVALQACQTSLFKRGKQPSIVPLHKGTDGLVMSFVKSTLPVKVFAPELPSDAVPFSFSMEMENKGAHDIVNGYLVVALEKDYMGIVGWEAPSADLGLVSSSSERATFGLFGRNEDDPFGEQQFVTFTALPKPLDKQTEQHQSLIVVTACYDYLTQASTDLCVDTSQYKLGKLEKPCKYSPITFSGGQGGPVAVTKVEQQMVRLDSSSVSPQLTITIKNVGKGQVVDKQHLEAACTSSDAVATLTAQQIGTVTIDDVAFSSYTLKEGEIACDQPTAQLRNNEAKFRCHLRKGLMSPEQDPFLTRLVIEVSYGYTHSLSTPITLERALP